MIGREAWEKQLDALRIESAGAGRLVTAGTLFGWSLTDVRLLTDD